MSAQCGGAPTNTKKLNKFINKDIKDKKKRDAKTFKILLLGTGDSGKSTVFKQMKFLYGTDFDNSVTQEVLESNLKPCLITIIKDTQIIVKALSVKGRKVAKIPETFRNLSKEAMAAADIMIVLDHTGSLDKPQGYDSNGLKPEVAAAIKVIWNDEAVQELWDRFRSNLQVSETFAYFADKVSREYPKFGGPGWLPTDEEFLLTRNQTTGVNQCEFSVKAIRTGNVNETGGGRNSRKSKQTKKAETKLILIDVGGQKAERRKWLKVFDGVPVVLFVTAISEYDQAMWEDLSTNRFVDSLQVFQDIINNQYFTETNFIMFLNKSDVFRHKLCDKKISLNVSGEFPDAPESTDFDVGVDWIKQKFNEKFQEESEDRSQTIIFHVTTATDRQNAKVVLSLVAHTVFTQVIEPWFGGSQV